MQKENAGTNLAEIRAALAEDGYTGEVETRADGFTLYRPFNEMPAHDCSQVVVWPRADGGYWCEEF